MIAGASPQQVAALAGPLPDLRVILPSSRAGSPSREMIAR
jgi:hypothetical protein